MLYRACMIFGTASSKGASEPFRCSRSGVRFAQERAFTEPDPSTSHPVGSAGVVCPTL